MKHEAESPSEVLIVGAGHAGGALARTMRALGFAGSVTLIGREHHLPYERPPISKEMLRDPNYRLPFMLDEAGWEELGVQLLLGSNVTSLDRCGRTVTLTGGRKINWTRLVLATGAAARRLPGPDHPARHVVRTIDDATALRERVSQRPKPEVLIIGAGPIGLETAASLRPLAGAVTVVESSGRIMRRIAPQDLSDAMAARHRQNGVEILTGVTVTSMAEAGDRLAVRLSNGRTIEADIVIEGIGVVPEVMLASGSGLACANGIDVDRDYVTADQAVLAIGDVACPPGGRQESWAHAESSALAAARSIMNLEVGPAPTPSFWSDQFDRLQVAGNLAGAVKAGRHGDAHLYARDGVVVAAAALGAPRDFSVSRRMIGKPVPPQLEIQRPPMASVTVRQPS